ncbi:hypothetical protein AX16_010659 [Volvariella volvacea WC 439]|nr:hypothetical protein AX16_010659 [Volvariella volvacea WC 439]
MPLFYAYAKNINDDWSWRYLITFATRETADEWWIAVSNSSNAAYVNSIRRVTPQFYTHNPALANIALSITDASVAKQFLDRVFFTLINDRDGRIQSVIPVQDYADHISGNWFSIRSKAKPSEYWYCPPENGRIVVSTTHRSRFRVRNTDSSKNGKVMIGSDDIYISVKVGGEDRPISLLYDGSLVSSGEARTFKFRNFQDGFRLESQFVAQATDDDAEVWELV